MLTLSMQHDAMRLVQRTSMAAGGLASAAGIKGTVVNRAVLTPGSQALSYPSDTTSGSVLAGTIL